MSDLHNESIFITGGKSRQSASAIWRTYSGGGR